MIKLLFFYAQQLQLDAITKLVLTFYQRLMTSWRSMAKRLVCASLAIGLSSCSLAPGMYVNTRHVKRSHAQKRVTIPKPELITIDETIVASAHQQSERYEYVIGPQDVLNITVWDHPELTIPAGQYRSPTDAGILVHSNGTIFYPFVGNVKVSGLTTQQVRQKLSKKLAKYIQDPQVSVRVADFNSQHVEVLGEVMKPRTLPITNVPLSLMSAINTAEGINAESANGSQIYVIRGPLDKPKLYWLNATSPASVLYADAFYLQPNDVVYVSTSGITRWSRLMDRIYPTLTSVWYVHNITQN